jgi:hypothetical protein
MAQRLRERQEAAGNGLNNQDEGGGCLLFARRNGSTSVMDYASRAPVMASSVQLAG